MESDAFRDMKLNELSDQQLYNEIEENKKEIEAFTGKSLTYLKRNIKKSNEKIDAVTTEYDIDAVIAHSSQIKQEENNQSIHIDRAVARGGILSMDPEDIDLLKEVIDVINEVNFSVLPLDELIEHDEERLDFEDISGADAIQENFDFSNVEPFIHVQEPTDKKEVALTFDDWASEKVILEILDILDTYEIKSTFYIKTMIVHKNPNLARLLIERGHEVANHSHSHLDSTTLSAEELQADLWKAHKIITEAIQEQPKLYFRPPFGRMDDEAAKAVSAMGFDVIGSYNISSYD